jgi:hypothetical protein
LRSDAIGLARHARTRKVHFGGLPRFAKKSPYMSAALRNLPDLRWRRFAKRVRCSHTHPAGRSVRRSALAYIEGECRHPHQKNRACGFYLRSIGNWNLDPSQRDINLYLGAASGHLCQPCFRLAGTDNIANLEPPLPNARFTGRDGILDTPVNHPISSIDFIEKGQARSLTTRPLTVCPARCLLSNIARA